MASETDRKQVGLLTKHHKEQTIGPILLDELNWQVITNSEFDTDQLGTFSGEKAREKSATACAEYKAKLASELTGLAKGLGSEGSFGVGPYGDLVPWNQELVTLYDTDNDWFVTGIAHGPSFHYQKCIETETQLLNLIETVPAGQALILYPKSQPEDTLFKGLVDSEQVLQAYRESRSRYREDVMVELDLRAMHSPQRRVRIEKATKNMVARWQGQCPHCQRPGFWHDQIKEGLPCKMCYSPTNEIASRIAVCSSCEYEHTAQVEKKFADPMHCPYCNP